MSLSERHRRTESSVELASVYLYTTIVTQLVLYQVVITGWESFRCLLIEV